MAREGVRRGVTANATGEVSEAKGGGDGRPRKTDKLLRILVVEHNRDAADSLRILLMHSGAKWPWPTRG
jgi:hypothetical protein